MAPMHPEQRITEMLRIRRFEERLIRLFEQQQFPGHYHVYIGQEATAVAVCAELTADDMLFSTWRNHGHLLARGASPDRMLAEIMGRSGGYAKGKSGTLHLSVNDLGVPATSALVGGNLPLATGAALSRKQRGKGIAVAFFGDAALEEGSLYEAFNLAAVWKVPLLLVCENNSIPPEKRRRGQYPSSTHSAAELADIPRAFQIPTAVVDGGDADALAECFGRLVAAVRAEGTPRFVEVRCTRWPGSYPTWPTLVGGEWQVGWAFGEAVEPPELATWLTESDPLSLYIRRLAAAGALQRSQVEAIDAQVRAEMAAAVEFAVNSPFPPVAEAYTDLFAEGGCQA